MSKSKILIADDHSMIRDGLKSLLTKDKELTVVGEATNGSEAISKYKILKPDLLILDISMPDINGMDVSQQIIADDPLAKIIILSMYDDEDYISKCMECGVKGYVIKNETSDELTYAVKTVLKGQTYFSSKVQEVIFKKYAHNVARKKQKEPEVKLTHREKEIVKLIAEGLTSQQIADKLFIGSRTVETHRANLMKKVNVKNAIELVNRVDKLGLINK
ncbi:MAG TPA: DNA-binding response regulator [Cytophagales bacterium]|jgi:DNA-binding NarL/FixJ family response regulator|nr:DNA-binding response regulator [Cytophagales bacterium]